MAATSYESVVSLMHTIDHVVEHGRNSFALNHEQVQSVYEKAGFLLDFLESYSGGENEEVEALEYQIADAAHVAEDLIESKVVDYIHQNQSTSFDRTRPNGLCLRLQDAIAAMDLVKNKAMEIKEKKEVKVRLPKHSISSSDSSSSLPSSKDKMVGFDDVSQQIMERLTRRQSNRLVIPVSGMGGIGKTTLTRNIYENPYIVKHFDIRAWITISQRFEIKEILSSLLIEFKESAAEGMNEIQLGERVHKHLFGRRYLIVMDDVWSIDVWDEVQRFFPENGNGSGIIITTRLTNLASHLGSHGIDVDFLDNDQSWNLLCEKVFGQEECPLELEEIGKKIAKNCKGLPLSIVVIAGLLAKSKMTQEYWYDVAEKVSSIVSQADDGQCSKILSLSYVNLPIHLKPCFLYMGVFPEDREIDVSKLIRLWVSEGFLKPNRTKSLEEVAEEYLMDLIDRNLVMVYREGTLGDVTYCKIHDLLRDLCIREAEKEKFFCVAKSLDGSKALHNQRRIVVDNIERAQKDHASLLVRSITCSHNLDISFLGGRLIRVLNGKFVGSLGDIVNLVNLRYLNYRNNVDAVDSSFSSISNLLWNIQCLIFNGFSINVRLEIWKMKQLRYLSWHRFIAAIDGGQEDSNTKHLHTLRTVHNLILSEGVVERISNIKELDLSYGNTDEDKDYCLNNLQHLHKLEYLDITSDYVTDLHKKLVFPHLLKKLYLSATCIPWEDMTIIGCLPNLQLLKLHYKAFIGKEWNPIEGQFISLKDLIIGMCNDLKEWNAESIHFPVLETLYLYEMEGLKEIPWGIGEIPTLRCIQLKYCSDSIVRSAIDILDEQESLGNDELKVEVTLRRDTQLQNLEARDNLKLCLY